LQIDANPKPPMYRHFLVPIDHTEDSVEFVARAVNLAASMQARVTFLHTERESQRQLAPMVGAPGRLGPCGMAREALATAEAAARACGVSSRTIESGADDAASAIASAARDQGCDLILMASRGAQHRGRTPAVEAHIGTLLDSDLPVLFTPTPAMASSTPAIRALREEHRMLATALQSLGQALDAQDVSADGRMPSVLAFIDRLEAAHHAKEKGLFFKLRERTSTIDADLDEIGRQHEREGAMLAGLSERLQSLLASTDAAARLEARRGLAACAAEYTRFIWDHLGREESVVLPAARRYLRGEDWAELEQILSQPDPHAWAVESRRLLQEIVDQAGRLAPATSPRPDGGSET
jgi:nucleotide-binding universal stress UspA family protein/hemerythrin-like domain-containing protein